jgi:quercetin dioxygenase-like cupin family protein
MEREGFSRATMKEAAMAADPKGTWYVNERMGHRARILTLPSETGGRSFVLENVIRPFAGRYAVPEHLHPAMSETFEVLSGRGRYRLGTEERTIEAGERVLMPAGVRHVHPWSDSADELRVTQTGTAEPPDLRGMNASIQAIITIGGLATAGKVGRKGLPNVPQLAVLAREAMPATYVAGIPIPVQRALLAVLAGLGHAVGYRASYPEYGSLT